MDIEIRDHLRTAVTQNGHEFIVDRDQVLDEGDEVWSPSEWPDSEKVVANNEEVSVAVTWGDESEKGLIRFRPPEGRTYEVSVSYAADGDVDRHWFRTSGA